MTSVSAPARSIPRQSLRFLRSPKGLLLVIFVGLMPIASVKVGADVVVARVVVAAVVAAALDMSVTYLRRERWILPDGAILTAMIVAFILGPQESWGVLVATVVLAILSKQALRTRWSNIFNPAAVALVLSAIILHANQNWWGALPDLGNIGVVVVLAAGLFIADRLDKLPMILAFFAAYYALFTFASYYDSTVVAETYRTPDLQAAIFFAFFMLDDPPTSPVRHGDQIVFGVIVAAVAYFVFARIGGVYFLPAGLLAGNLWESGRRIVMSHIRTGAVKVDVADYRLEFNLPDGETIRALRIIAGTAAAIVAVVFLASVAMTSSANAPAAAASQVATGQPTSAAPSALVPPTNAPPAVVVQPTTVPPSPQTSGTFPFLANFSADLSGTFSQTDDGTTTGLTIDATTTGDVAVKLHVEVATADASSDGQTAVTVNKAQLMDPNTSAVICDGQLTAFNSDLHRATCSGVGPYSGVSMTFDLTLAADSPTTLSGTLDGTMQRTQ